MAQLQDNRFIQSSFTQPDQFLDNRTTIPMETRVVDPEIERLKAMRQEQGLIDVSGMFTPAVVGSVANAIKTAKVTSSAFADSAMRMSSGERINARNLWHKNADASLKNADGTPKQFYMGYPDGTKTEFGIKSNPISGKNRYGKKLVPYQRRGNVFATDDSKFAQDFYTRDSKAISDMKKLKEGEGNIYPVNINTKKMFDPDNSEQMNELIRHVMQKEKNGISTAIDPNYKGNMGVYKRPLSHDLEEIKHSSSGWRIAERQAMYDALDELGYGGQFVNEAGRKNPNIFNPENIKSIFNTGEYNVNSRNILNSGLGLGSLGLAKSAFIDKESR